MAESAGIWELNSSKAKDLNDPKDDKLTLFCRDWIAMEWIDRDAKSDKRHKYFPHPVLILGKQRRFYADFRRFTLILGAFFLQ